MNDACERAAVLTRITKGLIEADKLEQAQTISLEAMEDGTQLQIKDDGIGLPDVRPKSAGIGLRIMAHRASIIGATFQARRDDSSGTIVSCVLRHKEISDNHSGE